MFLLRQSLVYKLCTKEAIATENLQNSDPYSQATRHENNNEIVSWIILQFVYMYMYSARPGQS